MAIMALYIPLFTTKTAIIGVISKFLVIHCRQIMDGKMWSPELHCRDTFYNMLSKMCMFRSANVSKSCELVLYWQITYFGII